MKLLLGSALCVLQLAVPIQASASVSMWSVDPHEKVFRDTIPGRPGAPVHLSAGRNEFEPGQFAFRSTRPLTGVRVEASALRQESGAAQIDEVSARFAGYIPVEKNTHDAQALQIRRAPCDFPDPLLDLASIDLPANTTQPVWLTVHVPKDTPPGRYVGDVSLLAEGARLTLPVELTVWPLTLPDRRHVYVVNWFSPENIAKAHQLQLWSEPFWDMLGRYAQNMAAHRQNVVLVPWSLIGVTRETDQQLTFDYSRFDRFIQLFEKAGVADRITIAHAGQGKAGWGTEVVLASVTAKDASTSASVTLAPEAGILPLLTALERHLDERGWLDRALLHVSDEPVLGTLASWRKASEAIHRAAPRLKRIEAIETIDCTGDLEVWVPQLIHFDRWHDAYQARREAGEFWFYICCNPYGNHYPNRFLDYPLSQVRVLHWLNFSERLTGYLHWGLNFWGADPFGKPGESLPPGDTHVLYPGSHGPLDSIRWEIERESLEDFEYLTLLTEKTEQVKSRLGSAAHWVEPRRRAEEFSHKVVPAIARAERDPAKILAVRQQIAEEIVAMDQEPILLVQTEPREGTELIDGPIAVELRGVVQPGATVRVDGKSVAVDQDGQFLARTGATIHVEAERNGATRSITRHFQVQR